MDPSRQLEVQLRPRRRRHRLRHLRHLEPLVREGGASPASLGHTAGVEGTTLFGVGGMGEIGRARDGWEGKEHAHGRR